MRLSGAAFHPLVHSFRLARWRAHPNRTSARKSRWRFQSFCNESENLGCGRIIRFGPAPHWHALLGVLAPVRRGRPVLSSLTGPLLGRPAWIARPTKPPRASGKLVGRFALGHSAGQMKRNEMNECAWKNWKGARRLAKSGSSSLVHNDAWGRSPLDVIVASSLDISLGL